jgi:hypothetical protein
MLQPDTARQYVPPQRSVMKILVIAAVMMLTISAAQAQWVAIALPNTPRTADGRPNLKAPAPHLPDGNADLSGIWYPDAVRTDPTVSPEGQTLGETPVIRLHPSDGSAVPLTPEAAAAAAERRRTGFLNPSAQCLPHSVVDGLLVATPFKIVHAPGLTLVLFEEFMRFQQVPTDGRPFPADMEPAWLGYSVGRWDGDEFVVDTRGLNGRADLGVGGGVLTSERLHETERFRRHDFGSLELRVTFDDPTTFTRIWTSQPVWFRLLPDTDFIENICDNEKDVARIKAAAK